MEFTPNPIKENQPFVGRPTGFRNSSLGKITNLLFIGLTGCNSSGDVTKQSVE